MKTGKLAESVLKRSVLKQIHQGKNGKGAAVGADCAFFANPDGQVIAWCAQEAAVAGQAGMDSVSHAIIRCVNNLAAAGAKPISALIGMMLPEETQEQQVKELMKEAAETCDWFGMTIEGGDTCISYAVSLPIITVTAMGTVSSEKQCSTAKAKAGMDIVISKWIGLEGTALLAKAEKEALLERYPSWLVEKAAEFERELSVLPEAETAREFGVRAMHDLSQGGVFGALWELAEGSGCGLCVDLKKIPIRQETVEVCEVCGVNPYEMRSAGSLLMVTEDGEGLVEALERAGIPAAVIGRMTDSNDRMVTSGEEVRFLDRPTGADNIVEALRK